MLETSLEIEGRKKKFGKLHIPYRTMQMKIAFPLLLPPVEHTCLQSPPPQKSAILQPAVSLSIPVCLLAPLSPLGDRFVSATRANDRRDAQPPSLELPPSTDVDHSHPETSRALSDTSVEYKP